MLTCTLEPLLSGTCHLGLRTPAGGTAGRPVLDVEFNSGRLPFSVRVFESHAAAVQGAKPQAAVGAGSLVSSENTGLGAARRARRRAGALLDSLPPPVRMAL